MEDKEEHDQSRKPKRSVPGIFSQSFDKITNILSGRISGEEEVEEEIQDVEDSEHGDEPAQSSGAGSSSVLNNQTEKSVRKATSIYYEIDNETDDWNLLDTRENDDSDVSLEIATDVTDDNSEKQEDDTMPLQMSQTETIEAVVEQKRKEDAEQLGRDVRELVQPREQSSIKKVDFGVQSECPTQNKFVQFSPITVEAASLCEIETAMKGVQCEVETVSVGVQAEKTFTSTETQTDKVTDFRAFSDNLLQPEFMKGVVSGIHLLTTIEQMISGGVLPKNFLPEFSRLIDQRHQHLHNALPAPPVPALPFPFSSPTTPSPLINQGLVLPYQMPQQQQMAPNFFQNFPYQQQFLSPMMQMQAAQQNLNQASPPGLNSFFSNFSQTVGNNSTQQTTPGDPVPEDEVIDVISTLANYGNNYASSEPPATSNERAPENVTPVQVQRELSETHTSSNDITRVQHQIAGADATGESERSRPLTCSENRVIIEEPTARQPKKSGSTRIQLRNKEVSIMGSRKRTYLKCTPESQSSVTYNSESDQDDCSSQDDVPMKRGRPPKNPTMETRASAKKQQEKEKQRASSKAAPRARSTPSTPRMKPNRVLEGLRISLLGQEPANEIRRKRHSRDFHSSKNLQ